MLSRYSDTINFIHKLSPYKILNGFKILFSYYISRWRKKPSLWGMPLSISVEPTTYCNLRCPQCISGLRAFTRPTGNLQMENFERLLDQNKANLVYLLLYFQGEPYLNPDFLQMVKKAHSQKIYTATSTNGHYLTSHAEATVTSGLDRLIISIDGTDQQSYSKYRVGGSLSKVIAGAKALVAAKKALKSKTPHVIFQFIVMQHNEHQIEIMENLSKSVGVDELQLKTVQVYDEAGVDLVPKNSKYARYYNNNGDLVIKNKLLNFCWKSWHSCVITWDGQIVPCCFDKDASHPMGNISQQSMLEIWQGDDYQKFRKKLFSSRSEIDICANCTEGTKVFV